MNVPLPSTFVTAQTTIDPPVLSDSGLSTGWQFVIGVAAGIVLIVLALIVGSLVQRRGAIRDETRKAELRAAAEASGSVSFTDLDLSDDADFDLGDPLPEQAEPSPEVPELL